MNMSTSAPPSQANSKKEEESSLGKPPLDFETRLTVAIQTPTLFGLLPLAMKAVAQVCSGDFLVVYFGILYWCLNQSACVRYIVSLGESNGEREGGREGGREEENVLWLTTHTPSISGSSQALRSFVGF